MSSRHLFYANAKRGLLTVQNLVGSGHYMALRNEVYFSDIATAGYLEDMSVFVTSFSVKSDGLQGQLDENLRLFGHSFPRISLLGGSLLAHANNFAHDFKTGVDIVFASKLLANSWRMAILGMAPMRHTIRVIDDMSSYIPEVEGQAIIYVFHPDNPGEKLKFSHEEAAWAAINQFSKTNHIVFVVPSLDYLPANMLKHIGTRALNVYEMKMSDLTGRPYRAQSQLTVTGIRNAIMRTVYASVSTSYWKSERSPVGIIVNRLNEDMFPFLRFLNTGIGKPSMNDVPYIINVRPSTRFRIIDHGSKGITLYLNAEKQRVELAYEKIKQIENHVKGYIANVNPFQNQKAYLIWDSSLLARLDATELINIDGAVSKLDLNAIRVLIVHDEEFLSRPEFRWLVAVNPLI